MNVINKWSSGKFPIYFNFAPSMGALETVSSVVVTCVNILTLVDSSASVVFSSVVVTPKVKVIIQNGVSGESHKITATATTSTGSVYEAEVLVVVDDNDVSATEIIQPSEVETYGVDFQYDLESGDTIPSGSGNIAVSAVKVSDETSASIIGTKVVAGTIASAVVQSTVNGETYRVKFIVTSTAGYVYRADIYVKSEDA